MLSKVILQANIDKVETYFNRADKIVIVTHVSPDGDALGSSLGLYHFLSGQGKDVRVIVPNAFPDFLRWMPGAKDIVRYDKYSDFADKLIAEADVICCLDLVTISHPEISSTSELIFRLICRMGCFDDITREGAECIYTGMMTDTGGFTYNSNDRQIYFIIGELLSKGIDKDEIYRKVFNTYSEGRLRLMGYVLYEKMQVFPQFRAALIWLTKEEQGKFHYVKGDTEGFVNMPLQMKGICFSVFLREDTEKQMIKVSLRSVGAFPCNKVAAEFFNGGGHLNASGGELYGTMDEAIALFKQALVKYESLLLKN